MLARRLLTPSLAGLTLALVSGALFTGVARAEEQKGGMPQLDPHSYASQLFWLAIFFVLVFLFLQFIGLPRIRVIIDERAKKIGGDIASAELARRQADEAEKTYQATMAAAHGEARKLLAETQEKNTAILALETKEAVIGFERQIEQAVKGIDAASAEALKGIRDVAVGLARDITVKLAGHAPGADRVALAVDRAVAQENG
jgi:F-type H+-transporting ATPase subunit b